MTALLAQEAPQLHRVLAGSLKSSDDFEVRERLGRVTERMREGARRLLFGEPEDPKELLLRFYAVDSLVAVPGDAFVRGLWTPLLPAPPEGPVECAQAPLGFEHLVDQLQGRLPPGTWEGERTIEKTPGGQLLVNAPPLVHKQVAHALELMRQETVRQARVSVLVLALPPPATPTWSPCRTRPSGGSGSGRASPPSSSRRTRGSGSASRRRSSGRS